MATKTTVIPRDEARRILDGFATMGDDELYNEMYKYGFSDPGDFEDALKKSLSLSSPENAKASAQSAVYLNSGDGSGRLRAQAKVDAENMGERKITADDVMKAYGLEDGIPDGAILPFELTKEEKAGIRAGGEKAKAAREQFGREQRARFERMGLDWDNPRDRELVSNAQQAEGIKRAAEDAFNGRGLGERAAMQASSFLFPRATQRAQAIATNPDARMPEGSSYATLGADALKDVAEDAAMAYVGAAPAAAAAKGLAYPFARRLAVGAAIPVTANVADYVSYEGDPAMQDRAGFDLNSVIEQTVGNMIPIGTKGTRVLKKIQRAGNIDGMVTATRDIYDKNKAIAIIQRGRQKADAAMSKVTSPAVRKDRMNQLLTNDPEVKAFFDSLPAKEQAKINAGQKFSSGKINDTVKQIQDEIRASGNLQMYKETAKKAGTKNINPVPPSMISAAIDRGVVPANRTGRRIEEAGLKFSPITYYFGDATEPLYPAVTNKFVRRYSGVDPVIDGGVLPSSKEKADAAARKKENAVLYYISRD
jgi:hypothetical protein